MCAPEIRSSVDRPDYWVECRPCAYRSDDFLSFKDCASAFAEHMAEMGVEL